MEQLSFNFFGFKKGDRVKIVGKSIGKKIEDYFDQERFFKCAFTIEDVRVFPVGWSSCYGQKPKVGEKFYLVAGNYFLGKDLKMVRG